MTNEQKQELIIAFTTDIKLLSHVIDKLYDTIAGGVNNNIFMISDLESVKRSLNIAIEILKDNKNAKSI